MTETEKLNYIDIVNFDMLSEFDSSLQFGWCGEGRVAFLYDYALVIRNILEDKMTKDELDDWLYRRLS